MSVSKNLNGELFTGCWDIDHKLSTPQSEFLKAMGRPYWQRVAVDKANERFRLIHFIAQQGNHKLHMFDKDVKIFLTNGLVKMLSKMTSIEFDKVDYSHRLTCNGKEVDHKDDEKRFGDCKSRTTWESDMGKQGFVIRWYLNQGLLKVFHYISDQGNFTMVMTFTDGKTQKATSATKVYRKSRPTPEDVSYLQNHPHKALLVGAF